MHIYYKKCHLGPLDFVTIGVVTIGEHICTKILIHTALSLKISKSEMSFFMFPVCTEIIWPRTKKALLYLEQNLPNCLFTPSKGIKIGQSSPEKSGVSKIKGTVNHPVQFIFNKRNTHFFENRLGILRIFICQGVCECMNTFNSFQSSLQLLTMYKPVHFFMLMRVCELVTSTES